MTNLHKLPLSALAISLLLSGCGGGSSSSTASPSGAGAFKPIPEVPATTSPTPTTPIITPGNLHPSVPTPTYTVNSQEMDFFIKFNEFRARAGLSFLEQNASLDKSSKSHLSYLLSNMDVNYALVNPETGTPYFHEENPIRVGFTGTNPDNRAKFAGYVGNYVGESGAYGLGQGAGTALMNLIGTVYHRQGLLFQFPRDIGLAAGDDKYQTTVITLGYQTKPQTVASDYFGTYPADKQVGVPLTMYPEIPSPFPDIDGNDWTTKTSYPISISSESSTALHVERLTVTEAGKSDPLDMRLLTAENDKHKLLSKNTVFAVGKAPFKAGTTYNVNFVGAVNKAVITKSWSFTTGT